MDCELDLNKLREQKTFRQIWIAFWPNKNLLSTFLTQQSELGQKSSNNIAPDCIGEIWYFEAHIAASSVIHWSGLFCLWSVSVALCSSSVSWLGCEKLYASSYDRHTGFHKPPDWDPSQLLAKKLLSTDSQYKSQAAFTVSVGYEAIKIVVLLKKNLCYNFDIVGNI